MEDNRKYKEKNCCINSFIIIDTTVFWFWKNNFIFCSVTSNMYFVKKCKKTIDKIW